MRPLVRFAALAFLVPAAAGCGAASNTATPIDGFGPETVERREAAATTAVVPDLLGLTEAEAARALDGAGLVMNVHYDDEAPRDGAVFDVSPAAGTEVAEGSAVVLYLSLPPRLPLPRPEHERQIVRFSRMITGNPDLFVGLYRDEAGVPHAVFGPGAKPEAWHDRLDEAIEAVTYPHPGIGYEIDICPRAHAPLRRMQDDIASDQSWSQRRGLAFGVFVDAATCTVRIESDLLRAAEIEALVDRYGTAISFNTTEGAHPRLLPLTDA